MKIALRRTVDGDTGQQKRDTQKGVCRERRERRLAEVAPVRYAVFDVRHGRREQCFEPRACGARGDSCHESPKEKGDTLGCRLLVTRGGIEPPLQP